MKTTTRRDELLSTIALDPIRYQIVDDLAALERLVPVAPTEIESLAIFRRQLPGLLELRGRGQAHTEQVRRLIRLLARELDRVETVTVRRARNANASWQLIALCLGVSKQAVHKKYGRA